MSLTGKEKVRAHNFLEEKEKSPSPHPSHPQLKTYLPLEDIKETVLVSLREKEGGGRG